MRGMFLLLALFPTLLIASQLDQTFVNGTLKIPYLFFDGTAYEIDLEIYNNSDYSQCAILCLGVKDAKAIATIENANNVSTFINSELNLPRVRVSKEIYSVKLRLLEGLSIFYVADYSTLTSTQSFS